MNFGNLLRSKTINLNVLVPAAAVMANSFGLGIPAEAVAGVLAIGNFLLRFFTSKPLSDK